MILNKIPYDDIKFLYKVVTIRQTFTSGTTYYFTAADFELPSDVEILGLIPIITGGNNNYDLEMQFLYRSYQGDVMYKCNANNSNNCTFTFLICYR